jgi:hypothetical protein
MITVREYLDLRGRRPFEEWFEVLSASAETDVTTAFVRIEQGNLSNTGASAPASLNTGSNLASDIESASEKSDTCSLI